MSEEVPNGTYFWLGPLEHVQESATEGSILLKEFSQVGRIHQPRYSATEIDIIKRLIWKDDESKW